MGSKLKGRYEVVPAFANAQSGLTFGQLWQGEAVIAKKELAKIFGKGKIKVSVVKVNHLGVKRDGTDELKCFAVALAGLQGKKYRLYWTLTIRQMLSRPSLFDV